VAETFVGAGGWGYFAGSLESYARAFRFVEVNAGFYRPIPKPFAGGWRARVPGDFTFAVKAFRGVTHTDGLRATAPARTSFAHDLQIAGILRAPFVILETPPGLPLRAEQVKGLRDLVGLATDGPRIGLEARAHRSGPLPAAVQRTMEDLGVLDVVDVSRMAPRIPDDTVYTRLFGPGPHNLYQFDDDELRQIDRAGQDAVRIAFTFHGVRMYKDAARFATFKRTGVFPAATSARGVASLEEVLWPDATFPATRKALLRDHGWKVVDADDHTRVHASHLLGALPDRTFRSLDDVIDALRARANGAKGPRRGGSTPQTTLH